MKNLRNIVILKDLPSNVIEEAFVVLKKNQKAKKLDHIDNCKDFIQDKKGEINNDFIIKEAELLIENYIESSSSKKPISIKNNIDKKYKRLRKLATLLGCGLFIAIIYILL